MNAKIDLLSLILIIISIALTSCNEVTLIDTRSKLSKTKEDVGQNIVITIPEEDLKPDDASQSDNTDYDDNKKDEEEDHTPKKEEEEEEKHTPPPKEPAPPPQQNACKQVENEIVNIGGFLGYMTLSRGHFEVALLGPGRIGSLFSSFEDYQEVFGYSGGKIKDGRTQFGTFLVSGPVGDELVSVKMDISNEVIVVGYILDSQPGGTYPREAKIVPMNGACLTQYSTGSGDLFSGGNGYLVIP